MRVRDQAREEERAHIAAAGEAKHEREGGDLYLTHSVKVTR